VDVEQRLQDGIWVLRATPSGNFLVDVEQRLQDGIVAARAAGDKMCEARCIWSLGCVHLRRGAYGLAQVQYEVALLIYRSIGSRHHVASTFWSMSRLHAVAGRQQEAISWMEQSARLFEEIGLIDWVIRAKEQAEAWRRRAMGEAE